MKRRLSYADLTEREFESFVAGIFRKQGYTVTLLGNVHPGFDLVIAKGPERIGVEIKMREPRMDDVHRLADRLAVAGAMDIDSLWLVCAGPLSDDVRKKSEAVFPAVRVFGESDLADWLSADPSNNVARLAEVRARVRAFLAWATIAASASLIAALILEKKLSASDSLGARIQSVSTAIDNLRSLESQLNAIKVEMVMTEQAKEALEKEISKAEELKKLQTPQIEALRAMLQQRSRVDVWFDQFIGFLVGVTSSLAASWLWSKWLRKVFAGQSRDD